MANPHAVAIQKAERLTANLYDLFARYLGNTDHPRGRMLSAYRRTRRQLEALLRTKSSRLDILALARDHRAQVERIGREALDNAVLAGIEQMKPQAEAYGVTAKGYFYDSSALLSAWMADVDRQIAALAAMLNTPDPKTAILGDSTRMGLWTPAPVTRGGARWLATAANVGGLVWLAGPEAQGVDTYYLQAVAALDENTTDCCLRVHGQTIPIAGQFHLTGTPRFADYLPNPPFHWHCRTATALVHEADIGDVLTRQMQAAAKAELVARIETGKRQEIHPAHSRSRR